MEHTPGTPKAETEKKPRNRRKRGSGINSPKDGPETRAKATSEHSDEDAISADPISVKAKAAEAKIELKAALAEYSLTLHLEPATSSTAEAAAASEKLASVRGRLKETAEAPAAPVVEVVLTDEPTSPELEASKPATPKEEGESPAASSSAPERAKDAERNRVKFEGYLSDEKRREAHAAYNRKERTEKFARESGLEDVYNAKLQAEHEAYAEERKFWEGNFAQRGLGMLNKTERNARSEARKRADKATLEWSKAISEKTAISPELKKKLDTGREERRYVEEEIQRLKDLPNKTPLTDERLKLFKEKLQKEDGVGLTKEEKAQARKYYEGQIIRKRDTLIGPNQSRIQARIDALPEREKTLLAKVVKIGKWTGIGALKVLGGISSGIGHAGFKIFGNKRLEGAALEREKAKYRLAGQVITGATIGSIMGAPVAAAGVGIAGYWGLMGLRTLFGIGVGTGAGTLAGGLNKATLDKFKKNKYAKEVRGGEIESVSDLHRQQSAERKGNRENRKIFDRNLRIGTAVVAGGVASAGAGLEINHLNHLAAVQHAQNVLHQHHAGATSERAAAVATGEKLEMSIGGPNVDHVNINDADKLFGRFGEMLGRDYAHTAQHPAAVDTYMNLFKGHDGKFAFLSAHGENGAASQFGFEHNDLSEIMHKGDSIRFDNSGRMTIMWADHARAPHVLIDAKGNINTDISDITKHLGRVHEAATQATPTPEVVPQADAATAATSVPAHEFIGDRVGPENLGVASEPSYDSAKQLAELHRQFDAIKTPDAYQNPNYQSLYDKYITDLNAYHAHTAGVGAPAVEAATNHFPSLTRALEQSPGWDNLKQALSTSVWEYNPTDAGSVEQAFHTNFVELVRQSGVNPVQGQTVEQYMQALQSNTR